MLAFEQNTIPLNSNLLEQEPLFGFGFGFGFGFNRPPWSTSDDIVTEQEITGMMTAMTTGQSPEEESRRLRRMKSNRESARRSRMRKRIHMEELRAELERLQAQNRGLRAELGSVLSRTGLVQHENRRLQVQAIVYKKRLDEARVLLAVIRRLQSRRRADQSFRAFGRHGPTCQRLVSMDPHVRDL